MKESSVHSGGSMTVTSMKRVQCVLRWEDDGDKHEESPVCTQVVVMTGFPG